MYVTDLFGDPVENDDDKNDKNHVSKSSSKLSLESNLKADKTKSHIKTPNTQNRMLSAQNQSTSYGNQDAIYRNQMSSYQSNQDADDYVTPDTPSTHATHKYRQNDFQQIEIDPHKLIDGLNEQQSKAVQYKGSALLIGAGAGSGKTRVLTRRIAWILSQFHEWPSHILAITFTNKAAQEMRERLATLIGNEALNMWVSTFHSACVKILRRDGGMIGLKPGFSIYDSSDSERLIKQIETDLNIDIKRFTPKVLRGKISDFKNSLITWQDQLEAYAPDYHVGVGGQKISKVTQSESLYATVYAEYQYRLSIANAVDFDDLIMRTVELMRKVPQVAQKYRRKFRYILVDEYQDTNHAQYVLIRELSGVDAQVKGSAGFAGSASAQVSGSSESSGYSESSESTQNVSKTVSQHVLSPASITVVGDSDQSIYAFRGADIRNIQDFEEDFPDAKTIMLEQNYRSTQTILDAANAVISHNQERKPKKLWTALGKGDPIIGYGAQNSSQEGLWIAEEISRLKTKENIPYSNIAIMYRANAQSRALEDALIKSGLPYQLVGGTKFYERKEVKDTLAYMQSIVNPDDDINMRRIFNVPKRGLGNRAESLLLSYAKAQGISFWNSIEQCENISGMPTRSITQIKAFHTLMCELTQMAIKNDSRPSIIVKNILDSTGLLDELKRSEDEQDLNRVENLSQLQSVASEYEQNADEVTLAGFLEQTALVADSDQLPTSSEDTGKITLMTLHTAKGLEYPVVFLTGMEQGTFPHSRSMDNESELSEERRLAYVGITRAKQRLYLTYASVRSQWGDAMDMIPSQFLDEIPEDLIHWNSKKPSYDYDSDDDFDDEVDDDFDYDDDFIDDFDDSRTSFGSRAHKSSSSLKSAKTRKKSSSYSSSSRTSYGSSYGSSYSSSSRSSSYGSSSRSSYGSSYGSSSSYSSGSSYGSSYGSSKSRFKSSSVTTRKSSITSSRSSSSSASRDNQVNRDNQLNIEDFHVGDKITHDQYGLGTIVATQDKGRNSIITVDFGSDGVKRLMLRVAPIEKL